MKIQLRYLGCPDRRLATTPPMQSLLRFVISIYNFVWIDKVLSEFWYSGMLCCLTGLAAFDVSKEHSFIPSLFCLTTGPKPPPKRFLHIVRSRASSFKWEYPLLSLRSSSSFLRLLSRLLFTFISPFIFPSITCFRRQLLRKMWPSN